LSYQRSNLSRQQELQRQQTAFEAEQTRRGIAASEGRIDSYRSQANARNVGSLLNLGSSMASTYGGGSGGKSGPASTGALSTGAATNRYDGMNTA
jgi:hypothetical protein